MLRGSAVIFDSIGTMWYGSANQTTWSYANKMAAPIPCGMMPIPRGIVQPIAAAVLQTFSMTNKDGTLHPHAASH